ncbi:hypothetical protein JOF56_009918 [Kibdelosporangium banguiense]|uniref:TIR domain-containing protein n=1 Tax=Kibdelosporangium banguiense TaxID=1365924 RepID=A0ABS4TYP8_9PSEU|nr:toll/interleukin-1 receptor domain-containing protein [Kibdelosporangium banguiense]MBP2329533.1 hypothetical protein [Kibdelosporangium banguiense]
MGSVFVNYRTGDGDWAATLIARELIERFGREKVFFASKTIRIGEDFPQVILPRLRQCEAFLAVIGPDWLSAKDRNGQRRLDNPDDWVRREIAEALQHGLRVIPVLLDGADRLAAEDLPDEISGLALRQHLHLRHRNDDYDMARLVNELAEFVPGLGAKPAEEKTARKWIGLLRWRWLASFAALGLVATVALSNAGKLFEKEADPAGAPVLEVEYLFGERSFLESSNFLVGRSWAIPGEHAINGPSVTWENAWKIARTAGVEVGHARLKLAIKSRQAGEVIITGMSARVLGKSDPPAGTVLVEAPQGGDPVPTINVRFEVDSPDTRARSTTDRTSFYFDDRSIVMSGNQIMVVGVTGSSRSLRYQWVIDVEMVVDRKRRVETVAAERPLEVTGPARRYSTAYSLVDSDTGQLSAANPAGLCRGDCVANFMEW